MVYKPRKSKLHLHGVRAQVGVSADPYGVKGKVVDGFMM